MSLFDKNTFSLIASLPNPQGVEKTIQATEKGVLKVISCECIICHELCVEAMRCGCKEGEHIYCKTCIFHWIDLKGTAARCPSNPSSARLTRESLGVSTNVRAIINNLKLKCKFCKSCEVNIDSSERHKASCLEIPTSCPNAGCVFKGTVAQSLSHHIKCDYRKVSCVHCYTWTGTFLSLRSHIDNCEAVWVSCSKCKGRSIRGNIANNYHSTYDCPMEPVECEFAKSLGCTKMPFRKDLEVHCDDIKSHFRLAVKKIEKMENGDIKQKDKLIISPPGRIPLIPLFKYRDMDYTVNHFCNIQIEFNVIIESVEDEEENRRSPKFPPLNSGDIKGEKYLSFKFCNPTDSDIYLNGMRFLLCASDDGKFVTIKESIDISDIDIKVAKKVRPIIDLVKEKL